MHHPAGGSIRRLGLVLLLFVGGPPGSAVADLAGGVLDPDELAGQHAQQGGGSWSHWWSYDGISGECCERDEHCTLRQT
jgi:hypothetical protein